MDLGWYLRRLARMSPAEIPRRIRDEATKQVLRVRRSRIAPDPTDIWPAMPASAPLPSRDLVDAESVAAIVTAAERVLAGRWRTLGVERVDMHPVPDWFLDPETGVRAPDRRFSFDINHRDPRLVGNIKNTWELSRHHHLTVLAAAHHFTARDEFAEAAARHLRSWWERNEFLRGVHWRSGIELGIRLISWVWVRRLLEGWAGAPGLFEDNPAFRAQLYRHQYYLARLPSHGSSANNHLIAEAAGQFVACCAFPYYAESADWRTSAGEILRREMERQTFESGLNREQASGYHSFVLELGLAAALEGEAAGYPLGSAVWRRLCLMTDALAAVVDCRLAPPRQGDGDEGTALLIGGDDVSPVASLLATGESLFGRCEWWPQADRADARTVLWVSLADRPIETGERPPVRPNSFPDAGLVMLRDPVPGPEEIWCRCDGGPHGFLSIAPHAHADALAIEVRFGGVEILADPGTYCYHTEPEWREYFRSTLAHNTLELDEENQSVAGGPFNWVRHARGTTVGTSGDPDGTVVRWVATHDGYTRLDPPAIHRRMVEFDRERRLLAIIDEIESVGEHECRLAFHLGPDVGCEMAGGTAVLSWDTELSAGRSVLHLPETLTWEQVRGRIDPPRGWYSPTLGTRVPSVALFGSGVIAPAEPLITRLEFA